MAQLSANLWYEIFPETSSRAAPAQQRDNAVNQPLKTNATREAQVIQLVEDGKPSPQDAAEPPRKPLKSPKSPGRSRVNPYRDTIRAHANWSSPASRTVKIV